MLQQPIPAADAAAFITEHIGRDPRPAALFDTVWCRTQNPLGDGDGRHSVDELAGIILAHFGYPVVWDRPGRRDISLIAAVRFTHIPEPSGCRWCGVIEADHNTRTTPYPGPHRWVAPLDDQRELRVRALTVQTELEVLA